MREIFDEIYNDATNETAFILTNKAKTKYDEIIKKRRELTDGFSDEENRLFDSLIELSNEFINICTIDNFIKGFNTGIRITFDLLDKDNEENIVSSEYN
ncbi:MAG: hypothetical protein IJB74_03540 [Clostridia bacterium]|nr:hypothetical protein [Clostridia bacterium]